MGEAAYKRAAFEVPDLSAPLEVERRVALCQPDGAVKGMFFAPIAKEASRRARKQVGRERYIPFRGYPLREWLEFLPEAAEAAYPGVGPREGMRRFGYSAFDVFTSSVAGRVLFSMAGRNVKLAASLTGRAFDVIGSHGSVEVIENVDGRAVFYLSEMWDYIDAWHVGIFEGAARAFGMQGTVRVRLDDLSHGEIELTYD